MRSVTRWVLAAVLAVAAAGAAVAQPPGGGRGGFGFGGMGGGGGVYTQVATSKLLAEELKLTDEQKEKLKAALEPIQKQQQELRGGGRGQGGQRPSEEELKERMEKQAKLTADMKKAVEGVLKPEQAKRLSEIRYQQMGVFAFSNKEVQDKLSLTEGQMEKVKGIGEQLGKDMRDAFGGPPQGGERPSREEMAKRLGERRKKTDALSKDAMEKIEEVLKDDQKETWKRMVGAKFDVAKLQDEAMQNFRPMRRDD